MTNIDFNSPQIQALQRDTPYVIEGVSYGMFSIARHYGSASFNGSHYIYNPRDDTLVRDDVLKVWAKMQRNRKSPKS